MGQRCQRVLLRTGGAAERGQGGVGGAAWVGWFVKTKKTIRTSLSQRGAKVFFVLNKYKAGSGCTPTHSACSRIEKPPDFGRKTCVIQAAFGMHFISFGFILDPLDSFSFFVYRIECLLGVLLQMAREACLEHA